MLNISRIDIGPSIMDRAVSLARQYRLRGADAVHLATALWFSSLLDGADGLIFVGSDQELLNAAKDTSLFIQDPATIKP